MKHCKIVFSKIGRSLSVLALTTIISGGLLASVNAQSEQPKDTALVQVETKYVCMINNQRFDKEQIAIEVEGKTYYGCCEMCKEKLRNDAKSRTAIDPVSKKKVDKAKAIIGASADGKVFYFENVENLKKFKAGSNSSEPNHENKKEGAHKH